MKKLVGLLLVCSTIALAALPPTTSKIVGDLTDITTFKYRFPNFTGTHTGTTLSLALNSVAGGGTGLGTLTQNNVILGNGTASPLFVAPGTSGNVLTSNGTTWQSSAPASSGTVTSVNLSMPAEFTVSNNPVTTSGTLTVSKASQLQNLFYASPNGASGVPTFRSILAADVPTLNQNTTGTASNVTGIVSVANGGTGLSTLTANNVILGNAASSPTFVAPGTSGNVLTSNGTTWVSQAASGGSTNFTDLAVSNWTSKTASVPTNSWSSVAYGNNRYVSVAGAGGTAANRAAVSYDGVLWLSKTATSTNLWSDVTFGNNLFVAVSKGSAAAGSVMTSSDGNTWTSRTAGSASDTWNAITYGNGLYVAVGDGTGFNFGGTDEIMTSSNGITWTVRSSNTNYELFNVTFGNNLFVAVGYNNGAGTGAVIKKSSDGITWTTIDFPGVANLNDVAYGNGVYVVVGDSTILTSTDAITWTTRSFPTAPTTLTGMVSVTYGSGIFVASAYTTGVPIPYLMTSTDGITWTLRPSLPQIIVSLIYGNKVFMGLTSTGGSTNYATSMFLP